MEKKNLMVLCFALIISLMLVFFYVINFNGIPLSKHTSDWGAFGNYTAISISLISIALIYITYREQRSTNKITRSEQHIATTVKTLISLFENNQEKIEVFYKLFREHFKGLHYDLTDLEYNKTQKMCKQYYSLIMANPDYNVKYNYFFRYTQLCFDYILQNDSLSTKDKELRVMEITYILPESVRVLLFGWILMNNSPILGNFYKAGVFILEDNKLPLLEDIIAYVCTGNCPPMRQPDIVNPNDILLDDRADESFIDSYKRIMC